MGVFCFFLGGRFFFFFIIMKVWILTHLNVQYFAVNLFVGKILSLSFSLSLFFFFFLANGSPFRLALVFL